MTQNKNSPCREIITINVGGAGVNLGQATLHQYCAEQGISTNGDKEYETAFDDAISTSFRERLNGRYTARSLFIDLSPVSINMIKNFYPYINVLRDDYLIAGKEDGCSNYSRGHYTYGKEIIDTFNNKMRLMVEECNNFQGVVVKHSLGGGTGSGLTALCLERIAVDYRKKSKIGFHIFLDEQKAMAPTHIYNALLCMQWLLDHTEASIILDNLQLHTICKQKLQIKTPRFKHYNYLCNKVISNITAPWRFGMREDMNSFARNMTPFPRLHFLTASLGRIEPKIKQNRNIDIGTLTNQSTKNSNFFYQCNDFDVEEDKYVSLMFNYRGKDIDKYMYDINESVNSLKINKKIYFVEWCNDKPSVQYINTSPVSLPSDDIFCGDRQVTMIGNNTCISRLFDKRINKPYDLMYGQRAYVCPLWGEGMQSGEFACARQDLGFLMKDYLDVLSTHSDDHYGQEDDDEDV